MNNISEHITYKEATRSRTSTKYGIDNTPSAAEIVCMTDIANMIFEPLRKAFGSLPIFITSFFRSKRLNKKLRGARNSKHVKGQALDFDCGARNKKMFEWIRDNLIFDQLIYEYGDEGEPDWIHVSYVSENNRGEVLKAVMEVIINKNGEKQRKTKYLPYAA